MARCEGEKPLSGRVGMDDAFLGARRWLAPESGIVTDSLGCWNVPAEAGHRAIRKGSGRKVARMASFKWVNTTLGNIKSAIAGT